MHDEKYPCDYPCDTVRQLKKIVDSHEKRLADGNTNFAVITTTLDGIKRDMAEIKLDLKQLKEKPQRRIDTAIHTIINTSIALLLAFLAAKIGIAS